LLVVVALKYFEMYSRNLINDGGGIIKTVIFEKNYRIMAMLGIIGFLFILAVICPYVLPNDKVSTHKKDHL